MTDEEEAAQYTGFSIEAGNVGYLREAYHGEPYATHILAPEAFEASGEVAIRADVLQERLPEVLRAAREREATVYGHSELHKDTLVVMQSFRDFVALCAKKEAETGEPCRILASY